MSPCEGATSVGRLSDQGGGGGGWRGHGEGGGVDLVSTWSQLGLNYTQMCLCGESQRTWVLYYGSKCPKIGI